MAQPQQPQRRKPQAPNSIPVAAPPEGEVVDGDSIPEAKSAVIPTPVGIVETKEQPQPQTPIEGAPPGLILRNGEDVVIDGMDMGQFVIVKQDVYREVYPRGTKRPSYFLLYHRGQRVLKSTLVRK